MDFYSYCIGIKIINIILDKNVSAPVVEKYSFSFTGLGIIDSIIWVIENS